MSLLIASSNTTNDINNNIVYTVNKATLLQLVNDVRKTDVYVALPQCHQLVR